MARRPVSRRPATHHRGPVLGDFGAQLGGPNDVLNVFPGRRRVIYNNFLTWDDISDAAAIVVATNTKWTATLIGAPAGAFGLSIANVDTTPYRAQTCGLLSKGNAANDAVQFVRGGTGIGMFAAGTAAAANPIVFGARDPMVINYMLDSSPGGQPINNNTFACGLLETDTSVVLGTGAVDVTGDGWFFRVPQGSGGVSGPIECHWHSNGASVASFTSTRTLSNADRSGMFGIRAVITQLSNAAVPVMTGYVEFWFKGQLMTTFRSTATSTVPIDIGPGFALAGTTASDNPWNISNMACSITAHAKEPGPDF